MIFLCPNKIETMFIISVDTKHRWKLALPFLKNSLAFLFNSSIETSRFPNPWNWNVARVNPIFKDGGKAEKSIDQYQSCLSSQGSLKINDKSAVPVYE